MNFNYYDKNLMLREVKGVQDNKTQMWFRPGTADKEMIRDCFRNYDHFLDRLRPDDVVLDLGANIGVFSYLASDKAKKVYAIEAERLNTEVAKANTVGCSVTIKELAVVPDDYEEDTVTFELNKSAKNACSGHTLIDKKSRKDRLEFTVRAKRFKELVEEYEATAIKIDIEGGEYGILDKSIPDQIRLITGELHGFKKEHKSKMGPTIEHLKEQGFDVVFYEEVVVFGDVSLINFTAVR